MYKMQRKDFNEDRMIMRDMSRQMSQGMRMVRRGVDDMAREVSMEFMRQQQSGQQAFQKGYEGQMNNNNGTETEEEMNESEAPVKEAEDEWNWN